MGGGQRIVQFDSAGLQTSRDDVVPRLLMRGRGDPRDSSPWRPALPCLRVSSEVERCYKVGGYTRRKSVHLVQRQVRQREGCVGTNWLPSGSGRARMACLW